MASKFFQKQKNRVAAGILLAVTLFLGACSPQPEKVASPSASTFDPSAVGADWQENSEGQRTKDLEKNLEEDAELIGVVNPPEVPFVRYVSTSEWGTVQTRCVQDAGFPVMESQGGMVLQEEIPDAQVEAYNLAIYICRAQYPVDPRATQTLPRVRAEMQYNHLVEKVAPCVRELGFEVEEPPSMEVWLSAYYANQEVWDPLSYVATQGFEATDSAWKACPHESPDLFP